MNVNAKPVRFSTVQWSTLLAAAKVVADECEANEATAGNDNERLWYQAYAAGARRLLHELEPKPDTIS